MIKAVFFDWFNTLARYEPPREELHSQVFREFGIEVSLDKIMRGVLVALQQAGVNASEAVHVGDQYKLDVIGTRGMGIIPVLIDRYDSYPEVSDCPRIHSLTELAEHL